MSQESDWTDACPPTAADLETLAWRAVAALPEAVRDAAGEVGFQVEEVASGALLQELELADPFELTGLYEGVPLTEKSLMDQAQAGDVIRLFRRPLLEEWVDRGDVTLGALVAHVVVHELAHHFGWSDAEIARIDRWWE